MEARRGPSTRPSVGLVRPPGAPEDVEDRQRRPRSRSRAARRAGRRRGRRRCDSANSDLTLPPQPERAGDVGQRQGRGDDHRGQGGLRQVPEQAGEQHDHHDDQRRARSTPVSWRLARRRARPPPYASRWCSPGSPGTGRRPGSRRRSRSSPGCRGPPARCARRTTTRSRSCRPATPARCPAAPASSGPRSDALDARERSAAGSPAGSTPTRSTPWSAEVEDGAAATIASTHHDQHGGHLRAATAAAPGPATMPPSPTAAAAGDRVTVREALDERRDLADQPVGVDLEPEQLGQLADQDGQRQAVHVADHASAWTAGRR